MATLQARFILVAFVALATAITYNAAYLQKGPHPAPMTADNSDTETRPGKSARESRRISKTLPRHVETTASLPRSKTVMSIQKKLAENGYEPGPADGVQGDMTRAAIMAYEHDNTLPVTGIASDRILKNMILGGSVAEGESGEFAPVPDETTALVKAVQVTLARLGYDPGPVDGIWGASTGKAIKKFEQDRKISPKGRISARLLKELMGANGGRLGDIASG